MQQNQQLTRQEDMSKGRKKQERKNARNVAIELSICAHKVARNQARKYAKNVARSKASVYARNVERNQPRKYVRKLARKQAIKYARKVARSQEKYVRRVARH